MENQSFLFYVFAMKYKMFVCKYATGTYINEPFIIHPNIWLLHSYQSELPITDIQSQQFSLLLKFKKQTNQNNNKKKNHKNKPDYNYETTDWNYERNTVI